MSSRNNKSVSSTINELVSATPKSFGSEDESGEETQAKLVQYDDHFDHDDYNHTKSSKTPSSIRLRNNKLLEETDQRYKGKKVSRKDIFNQDESSDADNDEEKEDDEDEIEEASEEDEEDEDRYGSYSEEFEDDYEEVDESNPLRRDRGDGIKTMSDMPNPKSEIEKGNCVREQLKMWESLLEMRIKLQKCLVSSNMMPQYDTYKTFSDSDPSFKRESKSVKDKLGSVLSNLIELQTNLLSSYPETKDLSSGGKKRKANEEEADSGQETDDEEIPSDTDEEMEDDKEEEEEEEEEGPKRKKMKLPEFERVIARNHKLYTDYRNSVIQKWNDKTRIASGVIRKGVNEAAVRQIEFALSNKDKLVKKSQLKRSEYEILGKSCSKVEEDGRRVQEYDEEIYDDDDFYHQLLRELIEYKSADVTDPIQLSKQWIQLQNMRSKMKRKIDTRATKGRRIRYDVHQKLVNFMSAITIHDTWTDHAKNELFNSLFGQIKSTQPTN